MELRPQIRAGRRTSFRVLRNPWPASSLAEIVSFVLFCVCSLWICCSNTTMRCFRREGKCSKLGAVAGGGTGLGAGTGEVAIVFRRSPAPSHMNLSTFMTVLHRANYLNSQD